jgi:hypothetical protein
VWTSRFGPEIRVVPRASYGPVDRLPARFRAGRSGCRGALFLLHYAFTLLGRTPRTGPIPLANYELGPAAPRDPPPPPPLSFICPLPNFPLNPKLSALGGAGKGHFD